MGASLASKAGAAFGVFYLALGTIGFAASGFTGFTQNSGDTLLGIGVNPFHNIAHLGIGALLVILSLQKNTAATEGAVMGVGLFYVVAFVIGVTASDNLTILAIAGEGDAANLFHLVSGVTLLAIGLISSSATSAQMKRRGMA
ncbi:hypothetical protein BH20ACT16_BH20ACT16_13620 [soil metagenome]|jgi:hypothetical protein